MTIGSDFRIEEFVGAGGIATVYRARAGEPGSHRRTEAVVGAGGEVQRIDRFHREAVALANLFHPNVLQVYGFGEDRVHVLGEDDRFHWMAVEFAEGGDTGALAPQRPGPLGDRMPVAPPDAVGPAGRGTTPASSTATSSRRT